MTYNEPEFVITAFATWMLGGIFVPINHKFAAPEAEYMLNHCGATHGVVSPELHDTATQAAPHVQWMTTAPETGLLNHLSDHAIFEETHEQDQDAALILYTSGTTSSPKGCVHTHDGISRLLPLIALSLDYHRNTRTLVAMPIWHSAPLNVSTMPTLFVGGTVILQREYHPIETMKLLGAQRATAFFGPSIAFLAPLQFAVQAGMNFADFDFSTMESWTFGGAPIDEATTRKIIENYQPGTHRQLYGMSELGPAGSELRPEDQLRKAGSIGNYAMLGVDMRVVKADQTDAGPGETGEIWFKTDTRMKEYLHNPEATRDAFVGDWYRTGDIARVDDEGYFYIVDRLKDIIIVGGENVFSLEVEEAIAKHPRVADVAVVGQPDPDWGQQVAAFVVTSDGEELEQSDLQGFLIEHIARYKIPRFVYTVEELPRNPSGKLLKHVLREKISSKQPYLQDKVAKSE
jgi:feruloyl-CoA synthase